MLTADDIKELRSSGMTDDQILEGVRKHAPELGGDIDSLRKEGVPSDFILNGIAKHGSQAAPTQPKDTSFASALGFGAANAVSGIGKTAQLADFSAGAGRAIQEAGEVLRPKNYEPAIEGFTNPKEGELSIGGYAPKHIPRMVVESVPQLGAALAGTALAGPAGGAAVYAGTALGDNVERVAQNNGRDLKTYTGGDALQGGATTAVEALLDRLGIKGITSGSSRTAKDALKKLGKASVTEGATEAGQDVVNQVGTSVGTQKGLSYDPDQTVAAAAAGAGAGGAFKAPQVGQDVIQNNKFADIDETKGAALAQTMASMGIQPRNAEEAQALLKATENHLNTQIAGELQRLQSYIQDENAMAPSGGTKLRTEINDIVTGLRSNQTNLEDRIEALKSTDLSQFDQGHKLLGALEQRATFNRLQEKGRKFRVGDGPEQFAGGVAQKMEWFNPLNMLKSRALSGAGAASVMAGTAGLPLLTQLGITGTAAAGSLAVPTAAYGGARLLDKLTGNRNPVKQFMDRKSGAVAADPNLPDYDWERREAQTTRAEAEYENRDRDLQDRHALREERLLRRIAEGENADHNRRERHAQREEARDRRDAENENQERTRVARAQAKQAEASQDALIKRAKELRFLDDLKSRTLAEEQRMGEAENRQMVQAEKARTKAEKDAERKRLEEEHGLSVQRLQERKIEDEQWSFAKQNAKAIMRREAMKKRQATQEDRAATQEAKQTRREAEAENANIDAQVSTARRRVKAITARERLKGREQEQEAKAARLEADRDRRDAENENRDRDLKASRTRRDADNENRERDLKQRKSEQETDRERRDADNANKNEDQKMASARKGISAIQWRENQKRKAMGEEAPEVTEVEIEEEPLAGVDLKGWKARQKIKGNTERKLATEEKAKKAEADKVAKAIANAKPIEGTTTEQPKSTARKAQEALKKLQGSQSASEPKKPASEAPSGISERSETHTDAQGRVHPLPKNLNNPDAYIASLEEKQAGILEAIEAAAWGGVNPETNTAILEAADDLHTARNPAAVRRIIERILKKVDPEDHEVIEDLARAVIHIHT